MFGVLLVIPGFVFSMLHSMIKSNIFPKNSQVILATTDHEVNFIITLSLKSMETDCVTSETML